MNKNVIFFGLLLAGFFAVTGWAVYQAGSLAAIVEWVVTPIGAQVTLDLCTALTIGAFWMWRDARQRGINPVPFVIAIVGLGSGGLLLYLVRSSMLATQDRGPAAAGTA